MSDLVVAFNFSMARLSSRRSRVGVGMNRSARGGGENVKRFEQSNGLDS